MREIKFRAAIANVTPLTFIFGTYAHYAKSGLTEHCILQDGKKMVSVKPPTVGQFTGLKDRNGNEIYEGDILQYSLGLQDYKIHVVFDVEGGCWNLARDYEYSEILGNVHQNPELLNGRTT